MSKTFTEKAKKNYEKACDENKGQHKFYFCATSGATTKRTLDLNSPYVFCTRWPEKNKNNEIKEYKLAAFMVREALKETNYLLPIEGKEWVLLDAERKFAKDDLSEVGDGQRLDLLAYEKKTKTYIVLELKISRALAKADRELSRYTSTIEKHIKIINEFYSVDAENVKGYIVWPSNPNPSKNDKPWGLIEYNSEKLEDIENLKFDLIKDPS